MIYTCNEQFLQGILVKLITQIQHSLIVKMTPANQKQCCTQETSLIHIPTRYMMMYDGIHGVGLLREVLLISLGCGVYVGNHEIDWLPQFVTVGTIFASKAKR